MAECRAAARTGVAGFNPQFEVQEFPCVEQGVSPDFTVSEIAEGVFVHKGQHAVPAPQNRGDTSNNGFIIGERSVAVIDTGGTRALGEALLRAVRAETDLPISHVILTHMHPDHVFGASAFDGEGADFVGHVNMSPGLNNRAENYMAAMTRLLGAAFEGSSVVTLTMEITEPTVIDLGGRELELLPEETAHTDNDLVVLDRKTGTLFAGDLVFVGHIPALDGSLNGWLATLDQLEASGAGQRVVPGHGPVSLDWDKGFRPTASYLTTLRDETRQAIRRGTPMLQSIREIGAGTQDEWLLFDEFNARNATSAYKELEWE
ncbi:quinoprotein relay system zinc metallohydrolase 2 [Rhodobacteraceae bacterium NNCM2]|nr:quinoprotein relay system zinc metallohydrolase 2 [Coraliihabitans acroporae]